MTYQLLVATMKREDGSICEEMNINSDAIIINQGNCCGLNVLNKNENTIKMYSFPEKGIGLSRNSALMRADADIVEFAELASFMDVPVKNFSSGMISRLAFSIATIGTPDILIVDEVLSVGDYRFQQKCQDRIQQMRNNGTTILFVSHNVVQVLEVCNKVIWLEKGTLKMQGNAEEVCRIYEES